MTIRERAQRALDGLIAADPAERAAGTEDVGELRVQRWVWGVGA